VVQPSSTLLPQLNTIEASQYRSTAQVSQPPHPRLPPAAAHYRYQNGATGEHAVSPPPTSVPALSPGTLRLRRCSTAQPTVTAIRNTHARRRSTQLSHNFCTGKPLQNDGLLHRTEKYPKKELLLLLKNKVVRLLIVFSMTLVKWFMGF
jgi:hypothetical protein